MEGYWVSSWPGLRDPATHPRGPPALRAPQWKVPSQSWHVGPAQAGVVRDPQIMEDRDASMPWELGRIPTHGGGEGVQVGSTAGAGDEMF